MPYEFKREPLNSEEFNLLVRACETPEESTVILTLLDTGLRVSELAKLNKDNIDWQAGTITLRGKGDKRRVIPLTPRSRGLLQAHIVSRTGMGMSKRTIQRIVRAVASRSGITKPVCPHVLRHTFSCEAVKRGVSIPALQKILGHQHLQTTAIYLNMQPEDALEEFRRKMA